LALVLAALRGELREPRLAVRRARDRLQRGLEVRDAPEAVAKLREVARPRRAERDARQDPLEVRDLAEDVAKAVRRTRFEQRRDRVLASSELAPVPDRP